MLASLQRVRKTYNTETTLRGAKDKAKKRVQLSEALMLQQGLEPSLADLLLWIHALCDAHSQEYP